MKSYAKLVLVLIVALSSVPALARTQKGPGFSCVEKGNSWVCECSLPSKDACVGAICDKYDPQNLECGYIGGTIDPNCLTNEDGTFHCSIAKADTFATKFGSQ